MMAEPSVKSGCLPLEASAPREAGSLLIGVGSPIIDVSNVHGRDLKRTLYYKKSIAHHQK